MVSAHPRLAETSETPFFWVCSTNRFAPAQPQIPAPAFGIFQAIPAQTSGRRFRRTSPSMFHRLVSHCIESTFRLLVPLERANVVSGRQLMDDYSHILFNKNPQQLRLIGARGGKAFGRNERARRALLPAPAPTATRSSLPDHRRRHHRARCPVSLAPGCGKAPVRAPPRAGFPC